MQLVGGKSNLVAWKKPPGNCGLFPGLEILFWKASYKVTQQFIWLQSRSSRPPGLFPWAAALHQSEHF